MKKNNQKLDFLKITDYFVKKEIVCFTLDIDWAPEAMIEKTLEVFEVTQVPVTIFLTHPSRAVQERYDNDKMCRHVGLHPNFLVKNDYKKVINFSLKLLAQSQIFSVSRFF